MSQLVLVRDAIVSQLKADKRLGGAPRPVTVSWHGGDFNLEDLRTYGANAPALVLALLRVGHEQQDGSTVAMAHWGLVALTVDDKALDKHTGCLVLLDATLRAVGQSIFGTGPMVGKNDKLDAVNEYSRALDELGIAMWALAWQQKIELVDEDTSVAFNALRVRYDLYPRPEGEALGDVVEAEDLIELEQ